MLWRLRQLWFGHAHRQMLTSERLRIQLPSRRSREVTCEDRTVSDPMLPACVGGMSYAVSGTRSLAASSSPRFAPYLASDGISSIADGAQQRQDRHPIQ